MNPHDSKISPSPLVVSMAKKKVEGGERKRGRREEEKQKENWDGSINIKKFSTSVRSYGCFSTDPS